jgi:adenylate kinase
MVDRYRCGLLFGAPGVGKGTQGQLLGEQDGFVHLATGDIFRSLDKKTEIGRKFVEYSSRGELVPDDLTIELWQAHVQSLIDRGAYRPAHEMLMLDGMPRSENQARILETVIEPLVIVHLVAQDIGQMVQRMKLRAEKQGRHDDADESVIRRRFEVYDAETAPVLAHYDPALIVEIDALGSVEEVAERVRAAVLPVYGGTFAGT